MDRAAGSAWNNAANWDDTSASQTPALVAPGLNDLVTITGAGGGGFLTVQGPADAASLTLAGNVALSGTFAAGTLAVGAGILALGAGTAVSAYTADAWGGIEAQDVFLAVTGTLTLDGGAGALVADGHSSVTAAVLAMSQGCAVLADATSSIDIGGATGSAGALTIDAGGRVSGAGALDVLGAVVDLGTVTAAGGTLTLGAVSGDGTLLIGQGAVLGLEGTAGSGVIIDFAANGTLSASVTPAAAIEGFGTSDAILLPFPDATAATYAATGPGTGLLTITDNSETLGVLTLLGMNAGSQFSVTGSAGGGTLLTTTTAQNGSSGGGSTVSGSTTPGGVIWTDIEAFISEQSPWAQQALSASLATLDPYSYPFYVWTSTDGQTWGTPNAFDLNVAVASIPDTDPDLAIWMPTGYRILMATGNTPVTLVDGGSGNPDTPSDDLLIGNAGNDSIYGVGEGDTMIGATGANTVFWAVSTATMVGGGNDDFAIADGYGNITTSANGHSLVWLGGSGNFVTLNGADTVACNVGTQIASDTVVSAGNAGDGCLVVGPDLGAMTYQCGEGPATIVGHDGTLKATGAAGANLVIGGYSAGSFLFYQGGSGSALIVGEAGTVSIAGGSGAVTVWGGTGLGYYSAEAGNSAFAVGDGPSFVDESSGNVAWLTGGADVTTTVNGAAIAWGVNSSGNDTFIAGSGPATMAGGLGNDVFRAGTGNATLEGGRGDNSFDFTNGQAGGTDAIMYFAAGRDVIDLQGYAETPAQILATETVSGGNTSLVLSDGTHIFLAGFTGLTAASFTG